MKIGLVGSREYYNAERIKSVVEKYVAKYGAENLTFVSGGCPDGADFVAKKVVLAMGLDYQEFPPAHSKHNKYCVLPPEKYNKSYHVSNFHARNSQIAEYIDHVIGFIVKGIKANGTMDTIKKATKLGKRVLVLEDENAQEKI